MQILLNTIIVALIVGFAAYVWMRLQYDPEPGYEGLRRNPDNGKWMIDGLEVFGDIFPFVDVVNLPCYRDGSTPDEIDITDNRQPFCRRAVVFEWLGFSNAVVFGSVRPR